MLEQLPVCLRELANNEMAIAVVATYDCAVVHPDMTSEPWLHIMLAFETEPKKQLFNGRDPRRLHFEVEFEGETKTFETNAACLAQLERLPVVTLMNDSLHVLPENSKYDLLNWLSERFKLTTWPDNFNTALKPAKKRLKAFWVRYNGFLSSLYLNLNTYEEVPSEDYFVSIIVAIEDGKQRQLTKKIREQNPQLKNCTVDEAKAHIENEVANIFSSKIKIDEDPTSPIKLAIAVIEEKSITMAQLRKFSRFSPYSLSEYGDDSPLPVDMIPTRI
jgi:hypothetical protein